VGSVLDSAAALSRDALARLTAREQQVLEMAAHGLTNQQIAEGLSVSIHGVKFHLATIYRKLSVANRTQATFLYLNQRPDRGRPSEESTA
jgi:ATP/maltotriose-dependent transcriptional regulator MalT